jgi:calcineurin-like phosphoesterase family protein
MIFFTADLHFGHENIIRHCARPFKNAEEMNRVLVANWNAKVGVRDTVYILGDLFYRFNGYPINILKKLNGKKHLLVGNHDKSWMKQVALDKFFESVSDVLTVEIDGRKCVLCHYPMLDFEGDYMIHGHIHNSQHRDEHFEIWRSFDMMLNAGVDIHDFAPVSFEELVENNFKFRKSVV